MRTWQSGETNYLEICYDVLRMSGDEVVLDDIEKILHRNGALQ